LRLLLAFTTPTWVQAVDVTIEPRASIAVSASEAPEKARIDPPLLPRFFILAFVL